MYVPKYAGFKNQGKYLQFLHDGHLKGSLQFSSDKAVTMFTKFELEPDKNGKYWHIKCCYNNKYLASSNDHNRLVTPFVNKPSEDERSSPCTLFNIMPGPSTGTCYLFDVSLQTYASRCTTSRIQPDVLTTRYKPNEPRADKLHILVDYENIFRFPKHVAFKNNDKYCGTFLYKGQYYLQFNADDIGNSTVSQEVFNVGDGSIRIKNEHTKKFWRRDPNWIVADSTDETENDKNTLFWPVKISKNKVALRNFGNDLFCRRYTADNKPDCLNAHMETISKEVELEIVEPVISREIYNVRYRTMDARVCDEEVLTMASEEAANTGTKEAVMAISLKYLEEKSKTWESSMSIGTSIESSLKAGIPEIAEAEIKVNLHFDASYTWGETITDTKEVTATYTVNVPPKTRMKVTLLATKGKCDVPFSYTQRDVLRNGRKVVTECDDGIFIGANSYSFHYQDKHLPL